MIVFIEGRREAYSPSQVKETMTVEELIAYLEEFNMEDKVMLRNDRGYTYGSITCGSFETEEEEDEV